MIKRFLFRLPNSYYSLFGGIFISTGVSIYISIFLSKPKEINDFHMFLISSAIIFFSGITWTILGFKMEDIYKAVDTAPFDRETRYTVWENILSTNKISIYSLLISSVLMSLTGLCLVAFSRV